MPVSRSLLVTSRRQQGSGLLEVLIALLVFSTGLMGLLSIQLAGKKAGHEAAQRGVATALARDILERMQANPGYIRAYAINNAGDEEKPLPVPGIHCERVDCTPPQLATFDLWQWESLLLGAAEKQLGGHNVGGLLAPRGCIVRADGMVSVAISWRGITAAREAATSHCGRDVAGLYDAPEKSAGNNLLRQGVILSTYAGSS